MTASDADHASRDVLTDIREESIYAALLVPMHQMKVCIVGASGKLGQYLVQHALDRGCEVVAAPATSRLPFP